mgnify:CR=1 FL=1
MLMCKLIVSCIFFVRTVMADAPSRSIATVSVYFNVCSLANPDRSTLC